MAQKVFVVTQVCMLGGQKTYSTARITCDEADIEATLVPMKLQGEVTIMEEKSKSGNAETAVSAYNILGRIALRNATHEKATGIYPSKRGFIVDNTIDIDALATQLRLINPWVSDATLKPEKVFPSISAGDVNAAA